MKISMWIIASRLHAYKPLLSIKEGNAIIEGVRIYDGEFSAFTASFAYVGNAMEIFSDTSFEKTVLVVNGNDFILIPNQSVDSILNTLLDTIDYFNQWERRLLEVSRADTNLQRLIDLGEEALGFPIHLMDCNGNCLADSVSCKNAEVARQWEQVFENGTLPLSRSILPDTNQYEQLFDWMGRSKVFETGNGGCRIASYIYVNEIAQAILYVQETDQPFEFHHLQITDVLCDVLSSSIHLSNNNLNLQINAVILSALLDGAEADPEICDQLNSYNWSMPWYLITVKSIEKMNNLRVISKLRGADITLISTIYEDNIVIIVGAEQLDRFLSLLSSVQRVSKSFLIGISLPFSSWDNLNKVYQQALFALNHCGSSPVSFCGDHAFAHLVDILEQYDSGLTLCHPAIQILSAYDKKNQSDFLETLYQFILNNKSLAATAAVLHLHRNSLLYRIRRICELIGSELNDMDEILFIYLSFKRIHYKPKTER